MTAITRSAAPAAAAAEPPWAAALRRWRWALLRAINDLAPLRPPAQYEDLPPEWYGRVPF